MIDPRGGLACPECLHGNIWLTPDSYKIFLCAEHENIVRKVAGWVRIDDEAAADWIAARAEPPELIVTLRRPAERQLSPPAGESTEVDRLGERPGRHS